MSGMAETNTLLKDAICAAADAVIAHTDELTKLDQAIGDGDHGINMKRGAEAVVADLDEIAAKPPGEVLKAVGMALVMKVGGASGPLYGSLFLGMGKTLGDRPLGRECFHDVVAGGVEAVKARGKSDRGDKTMLDVLVPVLEAIDDGRDAAALIARVRATAAEAADATIPMKAIKGRASFLGERSIGHMDPGARSSCLMIHALCDILEKTT